MLQQLKKAYVERVVDNGFDDSKIYNDNLLKLDDLELSKFEKLKGIIGATKQSKKINDIDINKQGFTEEEWTEIEKAQRKQKKELTEEQKRLLEEIKEKKKQRNDAISILRGISIRIPLLIYGADISEDVDITTDNFINIVDDISWEEFMPKGISKQVFKDFSKYYDNEIFIGAGRRIRNIAKHADTLQPIERAKAIANIFSTFRNPDKETILTPWKTVNMHMGDTLGGYNMYDDKYIITIEEPRLINNGMVTHDVLYDTTSKILELNSKTGLYPLYITISLFKQRCLNTDSKKLTDEVAKALWKQTIEENIFVICKTPMAKTITKRTLMGYKECDDNIINIENINDLLENNYIKFEEIVTDKQTWKIEGSDKMKFDAIIGNPPYNILDGGGGSSSKPIYNKFVEASIKLNPKYISMIMPSRWFSGGKGLDDFRKLMISDKRVRILHDYIDSRECFSNVSIEGGVCYFLWENGREDKCKMYNHTADGKVKMVERFLSEGDDIDVMIRDENSLEILKKVLNKKEKTFSSMVYPRNAFKIDTTFENYFSKQESNLRILARIDSCRQYRYLCDDFKVKSGNELLGKYKIFMSKADGAAGQLGNPIPAKIIGKPEYGQRNDICTETFLVIGPLDSKEEMENISKYLKTKFCRYMIGIRKNKNMTQDTYKFVPIQDFKESSDIKWDNKISEIDNQLFVKYGFTNLEIKHINEMISSIEE